MSRCGTVAPPDPAMDLATRKRFYRQCNPAEPLVPGDVRRVSLDGATPMGSPRGDRWIERLASAFELTDRPACSLVAALPGTGVTTLLNHLAHRLEDPSQSHHLAVRVDTDALLDLRAPVGVADVLLAVVSEAEASVARLTATPVAPTEGFVARTLGALTASDPELRRPEHTVGDPSRLLREMQLRPRLRERVRAAAEVRLTDLVTAAHDELSLLNDRARSLGRAGLVVLVDSLERLQGTTPTWRDVLNSAEGLFAGGSPWLRLPVHVLYTAPAGLLARRVDGLRALPALQVEDRAGRPWAPGRDAARAVVHQRLPPAVLQTLLGSDWETAVDTLVTASGGVVRDLVASLRAVVGSDETPMSAAALRRVIEEPLDELRRRAPAGAVPWLARVAFDRYLSLGTGTDQEVAEHALGNGLVLPYCDGQDWYGLHPAVAALPAVQAEYAHLERSRLDAQG